MDLLRQPCSAFSLRVQGRSRQVPTPKPVARHDWEIRLLGDRTCLPSLCAYRLCQIAELAFWRANSVDQVPATPTKGTTRLVDVANHRVYGSPTRTSSSRVPIDNRILGSRR